MSGGLRRLIASWRGFQAFRKVPRPERRIVVYSEGGGYLRYLGPRTPEVEHAVA